MLYMYVNIVLSSAKNMMYGVYDSFFFFFLFRLEVRGDDEFV